MKFTGFPIYLISICLSIYLLSLTLVNVLNIIAKFAPTPLENKAKTAIYKFCEEAFLLDTKDGIRTSMVFASSKTDGANIYPLCLEILYK